MHLFSFTDTVISENRFAVEQSSFRNGSAIRTIDWHALCDQPLIHIAFMKGFVYHDFSYFHSSDHCVRVGFDFFAEIINLGNVIGRLKMCRLSSIYHPVRCQNRDSSLIPYFQFFGPTDNQP